MHAPVSEVLGPARWPRGQLERQRAGRKKPDELTAPNTREAYHLVGEELQYEPLGMLPDEECGSQRHIRQLLERALCCVTAAFPCF